MLKADGILPTFEICGRPLTRSHEKATQLLGGPTRGTDGTDGMGRDGRNGTDDTDGRGGRDGTGRTGRTGRDPPEGAFSGSGIRGGPTPGTGTPSVTPWLDWENKVQQIAKAILSTFRTGTQIFWNVLSIRFLSFLPP